LCESPPHTWNRQHDGGTEWTGELLGDDNDTGSRDPIAFPWLERRENGYWFNMGEEELHARESQVEHVSDYTARTVTEDVRGKAKHSVLLDVKNRFRRL
jgi:hypothetical protein